MTPNPVRIAQRLVISAIFIIGLSAIPWLNSIVRAQDRSRPADRKALVLDRAPARAIADPNPVFRAIAIDVDKGEVFVANDKESADTSILVYNSQFPPTDRIMEPKRRISGPKADLGMVCGVAISTQHGELYSVQGESGTINAFALDSNGNVEPLRQLDGVTPRSTAGIYLDVKNDELVITTEHVNRISVFPRNFTKDEEAKRFIQGPNTRLADPHGVYVDAELNEIYVTNHGNWRSTETGEGERRGPDSLTRTALGYTEPGRVLPLGPSTGKFLPPSINIYSRTAQGDAAPVRVISGPKTGLNLPDGISRDPVSGELIIANTGDDSVLFFAKDASGDVAPTRILKGPKTRLKGPVGTVVDPGHNELWVVSWDNHIAGVFPRDAKGDMAPKRVIRTAQDNAPMASMGRIGAVAYDPKRKEILAPN
jgi:DNA-binding beta-propeller fold protein YncE